MTYDENVFKEKANRKARKILDGFFAVYSSPIMAPNTVPGGLYPATSYLIFLAFWLPLIYFGEVLLQCKRLGNGALPLRYWSSVTASSTLLSSVLLLPQSLSATFCGWREPAAGTV